MEQRLDRIRTCMKNRGLDGVLIGTQVNFTWLTGGRSFIGVAGDGACAEIMVTKDKCYLLSTNIEGKRLVEEELPNGIQLLEYPWQTPVTRAALIQKYCGERVSNDMQLADAFFQMRTVLTEDQIQIYKAKAPEVAKILETEMMQLYKGITEQAFAGLLAAKLWEIGVEPITLLVGFDDRMYRRRHPVPTDNKLKKEALAALAVRYRGQYISCTRQIVMGNLSDELSKRHQAAVHVDSEMIKATIPGKTMEEMFTIAQNAYAEAGYPGEWAFHHQGGLSGFNSREQKAMPGNKTVVQDNQVYAWNPTVQGAKSEDTILVQGGSQKVLTHTGEWEYVEVNGVLRPAIRSI